MEDQTKKDETNVEENDQAKTTTTTHEESGTPAVKETETTVEPKE